jgi:hypothetical protein
MVPLLFVYEKQIQIVLFQCYIESQTFGNSNFIEMHVDASDIYPSALVFYTRHRVNIAIYHQTVYLHTDMCLQTLTHIQFWTTVAFLRCCNPFSFWNITVLWSNTTQIVITHICVIFSRRTMSVNLLNGPTIYRSTVQYNIMIYRTVYLHPDIMLMHIQSENRIWTTVALLHFCNLIWDLANDNYNLFFLQFLTDSDNDFMSQKWKKKIKSLFCWK